VRIVSKDPFSIPEIQPGYLTAVADLEVFLAGIRFVATLVRRAAARQLHRDRDVARVTGCE